MGEQRYDRRAHVALLFHKNYASLHRLAFALLGDASAADEVTQEAFVRLYASWRRLDQLEHPPSYLRRIVVNLCRSRGRRSAVSQRLDPLLRRDSDVVQPDVALRLDIWKALRRLPARQRSCAVLRYLDDLTEREIAEILDCSVGTVKSQLHKARAKLQASLRESSRGDS